MLNHIMNIKGLVWLNNLISLSEIIKTKTKNQIISHKNSGAKEKMDKCKSSAVLWGMPKWPKKPCVQWTFCQKVRELWNENLRKT